ncbi:hypothetical protein [Lysinibacillus sp.]|uniref:hypothetical protein n=1 Tax=Lysinibacillus sp. TaxID=1869345 RepID=UPI0028A8381F|nr:hypothetical protein [Lysinibacillus sp.]
MAEKYRFFDAVLQEDGVTYDREYDAQEFTDYFKALVTTGLMKSAGNQLKVTANGSNMITKIDTGIAFLLGRYYENDSFKELTHDTETLGNSRIDRIVIRMDLSTEARYVKAFIKKGVPSANPVPPALTQTPNLYEISLAQVRINGGQTFISTNAVTDERGIDVICPWAGSKILPNFDNAALEELIDYQVNDKQFVWDTTNLVNPNQDGINIDTLFKTGFYWGNRSWGTRGTLPSDRMFFLQVMNAGGYAKRPYQIAFIPSTSSSNDNSKILQRYYDDYFKIWYEWKEFKLDVPNLNYDTTTLWFYVDGTNGKDTPEQGGSTGTGAFKTIQYAVDHIKKLNIGREIIITVANGNYASVNITGFRGAKITITGSGVNTIIPVINITECDRVQLNNFAFTMIIALYRVFEFTIFGLTRTAAGASGAFYISQSNGFMQNNSVSNCTSVDGVLLADNGSKIFLDAMKGSGNTLGLNSYGSTIHKSNHTLTATTPQKITNGGQIL